MFYIGKNYSAVMSLCSILRPSKMKTTLPIQEFCILLYHTTQLSPVHHYLTPLWRIPAVSC